MKNVDKYYKASIISMSKTKKPSKTRLIKKEPQTKRGDKWKPEDFNQHILTKRERILMLLHQEEFIPKYLHTIWEWSTKYEYDEACSQIWLDVCNIRPDRIVAWYEDGEAKEKGKGLYAVQRVVSGIIQREIRSENSRFHYLCRRRKTREIPISHLSDYTKRGL